MTQAKYCVLRFDWLRDVLELIDTLGTVQLTVKIRPILPLKMGESDVGDFMMVTDLRCWCQNHYVGEFFRYVGYFLSVLNQSPTSWIGHPHLKLVTNNDVSLVSLFWLNSQEIDSSLVLLQMIFEALQPEIFRFKFLSLGLKVLKFPEFNLIV